ncbi:MAG: hypothetical protein HW413_274 [Thermoleophilia bacterium]|nr:hypothetical protein [Thermoleophilia bacterium]
MSPRKSDAADALTEPPDRVKRSGPVRARFALRVSRSLGLAAWRLGERLQIDIAGGTEGPRPMTDGAPRETFEDLIAAARGGDGTVDTAACPYPLHELLTHLVLEHGLLLHGSNHSALEVVDPSPARDWDTELRAVVACDDGIWPIFYAVVARDRIEGVFTACIHLGRSSRLRRFYMFAIGGDPAESTSWTEGAVYALPRDGFRREWGHEWVNARPVRPELCVPVSPDDFPLRDSVIGLSGPGEFRRVRDHLRAAKREQVSTP